MTGAYGVVERFRHARSDQDPGQGSVGADELAPVYLARAAASSLGAAAAGLSVIAGDIRVPLGASDPDATVAERLQFTLGEGPCLAAVAARAPLGAGELALKQQWPTFHAELVGQTAFRAVVSVPVSIMRDAGALDVYFDEDAEPSRATVADAAAVASQIVLELSGGPSRPPWLRTPTTRARTNVWIAIGMIIGASDATASDALALLRAHSFSQGDTIDELAEAMVSGQVPVEAVM